MKLTLKIWRQANQEAKGAMHTYELDEVSEDMSFLEMLDVLNEKLNADGEEPIAFDSDCREGICGMCSLMINGEAHGPEVTTTCQLHMRSFNDGETITIEPWRAQAFPVIKDLVVDRSAFDRIIQMGGFISVNTGAAPDAATHPIPKGRLIAPLTWPPASAVAPVSRLARTAPLHSSWEPRSRTWVSCPKARPSATSAWSTWPPSMIMSTLAAARISVNARLPAPRRSR